MIAADVLAGSRRWSVEQADCIQWLDGLPEQSVDLVFGSPPYESQRTYGIEFNLRGQAWVDWMVRVFRASLRVCRGLVAFVLEGSTKNFRWSAVPALLMADLHRAGVHLRKPPAFHRVGIPGSGGPDWLRNDYEFIVCATNGGRLPWSDNTAMGNPPKWAPGGEMSHRLSDGTRVNQWGKCGTEAGVNGPAQKTRTGKRVEHAADGSTKGDHDRLLTLARANPGNVIHLKVGGGLMGSPLAHENEAPFPVSLAEFMIRSFCQPGGIVGDCFSGSGTTLAGAVACGRRAIGCDIRGSQVELTKRRLSAVTPPMFQDPI